MKKSKAIKCSMNDAICQGDVFKNVKYTYINSEDAEGIEIIELEFPYAIIISQACDVMYMSEMQEKKSGKPAKYMPSIMMCPIYDQSMARIAEHLKEVFIKSEIALEPENIIKSEDLDVAKRDSHYRFHCLTVVDGKNIIMEDAVIDFKHCFSVPINNLLNNRSNRIFRLDDLFAEQITLKFCTYLSRVAIP